jgi:hypothetical protein
MRRLRRIRVLDSELSNGQISYQTKLHKCFNSGYWLVCGKLIRLVVGLLFVDAKTLARLSRLKEKTNRACPTYQVCII